MPRSDWTSMSGAGDRGGGQASDVVFMVCGTHG
jgi:hypothetical protein